MTHKTGTTGELNEMHRLLTLTLNKALEQATGEQKLYIDCLKKVQAGEMAMEDIPIMPPEVSPALLTVITRFLKDNAVTVQPDEAGMKELDEQLAARRKKRVKPLRDIPVDDNVVPITG